MLSSQGQKKGSRPDQHERRLRGQTPALRPGLKTGEAPKIAAGAVPRDARCYAARLSCTRIDVASVVVPAPPAVLSRNSIAPVNLRPPVCLSSFVAPLIFTRGSV